MAMSTMTTSPPTVSPSVAFRRYTNSLLHISSLPPELMLGIFHILRLQWSYDEGQHRDASQSLAGFATNLHFRTPFSLGWILCSHVCHRWREILLAHPSMWATIDCERASIPWAEEMLRRAHSDATSCVPIDFSLNTAAELGDIGEEDEASVNVLRIAVSPPYSARLGSLQIMSWNQGMLELLRFRLPNLKSLVLQQPEEEGVGISILSAKDIAAFVPSLKRLVMAQCSVCVDPADALTFPELVQLTIACSVPPELTEGINTADKQESQALSGLLGCMPKLEELHLHDAVPYMHPDTSNLQLNASPFRLPLTVKHVSLTASYCNEYCVHLAAQMTTPSSNMQVSVHIEQCADTPRLPLLIHRAVEARVGFGRPPKALRLAITQHHYTHSTVNMQTWSYTKCGHWPLWALSSAGVLSFAAFARDTKRTVLSKSNRRTHSLRDIIHNNARTAYS
ncbi:hypothetical protein OF83DRAFT_501866 [Amylostereum chailletii]|nr:hypothetical protein OF83DRAFT_501866 [Amylostereum chailletii]